MSVFLPNGGPDDAGVDAAVDDSVDEDDAVDGDSEAAGLSLGEVVVLEPVPATEVFPVEVPVLDPFPEDLSVPVSVEATFPDEATLGSDCGFAFVEDADADTDEDEDGV